MANPHVEKVRGFFKKQAEGVKAKYKYYRTSPKMADWRPGSKRGNIRVAAIGTGIVALLAVPFYFLIAGMTGQSRPRAALKARGPGQHIRPRPAQRRIEAPPQQMVQTREEPPQQKAPAPVAAAPAKKPTSKKAAKVAKADKKTDKKVAKKEKASKKAVKTAKTKKAAGRQPASTSSKKAPAKKGKKKKTK